MRCSTVLLSLPKPRRPEKGRSDALERMELSAPNPGSSQYIGFIAVDIDVNSERRIFAVRAARGPAELG